MPTDTDWIFPGRIEGRHLTRIALELRHIALRAKLCAMAATETVEAAMIGSPNMRASWMPTDAKWFVLYSFRHTYATRLAESGASNFEMMALLGHSDIRVTQRYVHPRLETLALAQARKEALDKIMRGETESHSDTADSDTPRR